MNYRYINGFLRAWLGAEHTTVSAVLRTVSSEELLEIENSLRFSHTRKERLLRLALADTLNALPRPVYRLVTDILKRLRGRSGVMAQCEFVPGRFVRLASTAAEGAGIQPARRIRVVLTHDIDTRECTEFWPEVAKAEDAIGVYSSYNVLTRGPYKLDRSWLDELETRGFEIGLHGDTHDLAFGFRSTQAIRGRLRACQDALGRQVVGYRAPGLAISERALTVLEELGFRYDSSIKVLCCYSRGVPSCLPYLYGGQRLWELPLAIQDDGLFRDIGLSDDEALRVIRRIVEQFKAHNGLFVFNSHPVILRDHMAFYRSFLDYLVQQPDLDVVLARDLVTHLDENVLADGGDPAR